MSLSGNWLAWGVYLAVCQETGMGFGSTSANWGAVESLFTGDTYTGRGYGGGFGVIQFTSSASDMLLEMALTGSDTTGCPTGGYLANPLLNKIPDNRINASSGANPALSPFNLAEARFLQDKFLIQENSKKVQSKWLKKYFTEDNGYIVNLIDSNITDFHSACFIVRTIVQAPAIARPMAGGVPYSNSLEQCIQDAQPYVYFDCQALADMCRQITDVNSMPPIDFLNYSGGSSNNNNNKGKDGGGSPMPKPDSGGGVIGDVDIKIPKNILTIYDKDIRQNGGNIKGVYNPRTKTFTLTGSVKGKGGDGGNVVPSSVNPDGGKKPTPPPPPPANSLDFTWLVNSVGKSFGVNDGSGQYQCYEFADAWSTQNEHYHILAHEGLSTNNLTGGACAYAIPWDFSWNLNNATVTGVNAEVMISDVRAGDMVCFNPTAGNPYGHVGIMGNDGKFYQQNFAGQHFVINNVSLDETVIYTGGISGLVRFNV